MVDKLILYFIFILGIIAVCLWTLFLIQISKLVEQSNIAQVEHIIIADQGKDTVESNLNLTKVNKKNIENILNNISEINQKLNSSTK